MITKCSIIMEVYYYRKKNSFTYLTVTEVHEMHGQVHPNYCQIIFVDS